MAGPERWLVLNHAERDGRIFESRENGTGFKLIAEAFELSVTRVTQIYFEERRRRARLSRTNAISDWRFWDIRDIAELSPKARRFLVNHNYLDLSEVMAGIQGGQLDLARRTYEKRTIDGLGKVTANEILAFISRMEELCPVEDGTNY